MSLTQSDRKWNQVDLFRLYCWIFFLTTNVGVIYRCRFLNNVCKIAIHWVLQFFFLLMCVWWKIKRFLSMSLVGWVESRFTFPVGRTHFSVLSQLAVIGWRLWYIIWYWPSMKGGFWLRDSEIAALADAIEKPSTGSDYAHYCIILEKVLEKVNLI